MKQPKSYTTCGARNRQGEPCQRPPLKGKTRCKLHGGATPKGQRNAVKHGIYTKTLSDEERAFYDSIEIGSLDNEIRFAKIMLNRAIETNAAIREDPNSAKNLAGFELTEITRQTGNDSGGKGKTNFTSKRADTTHIIITLMGRIAGLEKTRAELIASTADKPSMDLKFVVEIPPENPAAEWLATYSNPPPPTAPDADDPGDDEDAG